MPVKRYFLRGIDYFQLLIDHHNKRYGGPGHEARLAIYLDGEVNEKTIRDLIISNELCDQLASLHVSKTFGLGYPSLVFDQVKKQIPVTFYKTGSNEIPPEYLNIPVDVFNAPPLHVCVFSFNNSTSCILFTFHHILFDFAGVQSFISSLSGKKDIPLLPPEIKQPELSKRIKLFFRGVIFTFCEANRKMTIPERRLPDARPLKIIYKEMVFSEDETSEINQSLVQHGLQLNKSLLEVACVSKSLHDEIFSKQQNHNFIWVPVPVNIRKKGVKSAILFNGLTFLFYKLKPQQLSSLASIIESIKFQMKEQLRNELPQAFLDFTDAYRYVPMPVYYPMLNLPSMGKLSSFSYSTLGNTFADMTEFLGLPVKAIKNYPSNSISPGFTFLFYEFRNRLNIMTSWVEGQYSDEEQERILKSIKMLLLK